MTGEGAALLCMGGSCTFPQASFLQCNSHIVVEWVSSLMRRCKTLSPTENENGLSVSSLGQIVTQTEPCSSPTVLL